MGLTRVFAVMSLLSLASYPPCSSPRTCWSGGIVVTVCYGKPVLSTSESTSLRTEFFQARSYPWSKILLQEIAQAFCPDRRHLPTVWPHCRASGASCVEIVEQSHDRGRSVRPRSRCLCLLRSTAHARCPVYTKVWFTSCEWAELTVAHEHSQTGHISGRCDDVF